MKCDAARKLIDQHVDGDVSDITAESQRQLDAHLANCPPCTTELAELKKTRTLVAELSNDAPSEEETDRMWQAILQPTNKAIAIEQNLSIHNPVVRFLAACASVAAVLVAAFLIGGDLDQANRRPMFSISGATSLAPLVAGSPVPAEYAVYDASAFICPSSDAIADDTSSVRSFDYVGSSPSALRQFPQRLSSSEADSVDEEMRTKFTANRLTPQSPLGPPPPRSKTGPGGGGGGGGGGGVVLRAERDERLRSLGYVGLSAEASAALNFGALPSISFGYSVPTGLDIKDPTPRSDVHDFEPQRQEDEAANSLVLAGDGDVSTTTPSVDANTTRKIIRTGEMALEVPAYEAAAAGVARVASESGGFVADVVVTEQAGGALRGRLVVRVAPDRFETLFAALKALGRVISENVKADDVTAQYIDLEARIKGLRITETRLQELISSKSFIDKIQSLLEVEREASRVRSEIEQLEGQLRFMASRVSLSTIAITLQEKARVVPAASISVRVDDVSESSKRLSDAIRDSAGQITSAKTSRQSDGTLDGHYVLSVRLSKFQTLLEAVENLGRVAMREVTNESFGAFKEPWADNVDAAITLIIYERSWQLPSGTVNIEVENLAAARNELDELLAAVKGSVTSSQASRRGDGSSDAALKLNVPAGGFAQLVLGLDSLGRLLAKAVAGEGSKIVGGSALMPCELSLTLSERRRQIPTGNITVVVSDFEDARKTLEAFVTSSSAEVLNAHSNQQSDGVWTGSFRLATKVADLDQAVEKFESLGRVSSRQISGLGLGDLSQSYADTMGVVDLILTERPAVTPGPGQAGNTLRNRMRQGMAGLYSSAGLILYGLFVMAPWLIVVALAGWTSIHVIKRRNRVSR